MANVRGVGILALAVVLSACTSPNQRHATNGEPASTAVTTSSAPMTSTATAAGGVRTVLSPLGLNIRAQPANTAAIIRTAGQGAVLTVVAQTDQRGGWFEVKGPTVTGWMSDDPDLSALGKFTAYSSTQHGVTLLYPEGWTYTESAPALVFRPSTGNDTVVVTTAATVDQLGRGRAGYHQTNDQQVVVCGVTGDLVTFVQVGPSSTTSQPTGVVAERYLEQVHLTLDAQHALGLDANLGDASQFQTFRNVVKSVGFPFPQCRPAGP